MDFLKLKLWSRWLCALSLYMRSLFFFFEFFFCLRIRSIKQTNNKGARQLTTSATSLLKLDFNQIFYRLQNKNRNTNEYSRINTGFFFKGSRNVKIGSFSALHLAEARISNARIFFYFGAFNFDYNYIIRRQNRNTRFCFTISHNYFNFIKSICVPYSHCEYICSSFLKINK